MMPNLGASVVKGTSEREEIGKTVGKTPEPLKCQHAAGKSS